MARRQTFSSIATSPGHPTKIWTASQADTSQRVYDVLSNTAQRVLAQGCSVVLDASFMQETQRRGLLDLAREHNVDFVGLFLTADIPTRLARIAQRKNDASDATRDVALKQEASAIGAIDWHVVDASGSPDDTLHPSVAWLSTLGPAPPDSR